MRDRINRTVRLATFACLAIAVACASSSMPRATFDGSDCSYQGPDSVAAGDIDVAFENLSNTDAALAFLILTDQSAREQEVALIGTKVSVDGANPEGATELAGFLQAEPGQEATQTAPLGAGTYLLDCVTFDSGAPDVVWRIAVLEVSN